MTRVQKSIQYITALSLVLILANLGVGCQPNGQSEPPTSSGPVDTTTQQTTSPITPKMIQDVQDLIDAGDDHYKLLLKVLKGEEDVNAKDPAYSDMTALHLAILMNSVDIVKALIQRGAHVNAQDTNGDTPLMIAAKPSNSLAIVQVLLNAPGIKVNEKNALQDTALKIAESGVLTGGSTEADYQAIVNALIAHGAR